MRGIKRVEFRTGIKNPKRAGLAWAVHLFTASGIVLGFLAVVAVLNSNITVAFLWLGVALFVDGVDGFLARKANVLQYTPNVDGRTLDNVIDFFNYVAVPALMIYWFGMVPDWLAVFTSAAIMAVSCYTFANVGIKSDDYYFVGFPAVWNVVVLYFHVLQTSQVVNFIVIAILCILTFVPLKFVHPLRVKAWAAITIPVTAIWGVATLLLVIPGRDMLHPAVLWLWIASSIYFAGISGWRSLQRD